MGVKLLNPLNTEVSDDSRPVVRAGAWLFRQRTWIPLPLALALLLIPSETTPSWFLAGLGSVIVACGELLRVWAVRHIGAISRTRSTRLGPLVQTGPFALVRNPLYLGNIALWVGFATSAQLVWLIPVFVVVLALEYHAIVQWEEQLLELRRGNEYTSVRRPGATMGSVTSKRSQSEEGIRRGRFLARHTLQRTRDSHGHRSRLLSVVDKKPTVLIGARSFQASDLAPLVHFIDTVRAI